MQQQDSPIKFLQEYARRNQIFLEYRFQNESDHPKMYTVRLHVGEKDYLARESTMKSAQITATQLALKDLKISSQSSSPIVMLNTWAKRNHRFVHYRFLQEQRLPIAFNRFRLIYHYRLFFDNDDEIHFDGYGSTHQQARLHCAQNALYFLRSNSQSPKSPISNEPNYLTKLHQLAQNRQVQLEVIQLFDHETIHVQIKFGENLTADGYGQTKQLAKQVAAQILIEKLQSNISLPPPPSKGLLKRNGTKNETKKHVHFDENLIDKDERTSPSRSSTISIKQQLISLCQKLQIQIEYHDENLQENSLSSRYQSNLTLIQKNHQITEYTGFGPNLIRAQENASSAAWNHLKMSNYSL